MNSVGLVVMVAKQNIGGSPLSVRIGTADTKSERKSENPQMTALDLNNLQSELDASNSEMKTIRKVSIEK